MRLKKAERERYKQQILSAKKKEIASIDDMNAAKFASQMLAAEHCSKLCLDLRHISDLFLLEFLTADTADNEPVLTTEYYIRHYSDFELCMATSRTQAAQRTLQKLEALLLMEEQRRQPKQNGRIRAVK